jgi:hypothetical protein
MVPWQDYILGLGSLLFIYSVIIIASAGKIDIPKKSALILCITLITFGVLYLTLNLLLKGILDIVQGIIWGIIFYRIRQQ